MNCGQVRTRLGDYLEGDLELSARAQVDEHLGACADCANELQELRSTVALVRTLPDLTVPTDLVDTEGWRVMSVGILIWDCMAAVLDGLGGGRE